MIVEHSYHIILTLLPFVAILLLLHKISPVKTLSRIGLFVIVAALISLQSIPLHYIHASHFEGSQIHDCCLPIPVAINAIFQLDVPPQKPNTLYQLLNTDNIQPDTNSLNNKSPPQV